jgi:putative endonuclease
MASDPTHRKRLGTDGETVAARFLEARGWRILARNFRCVGGEMDLIAKAPGENGPVLVFVEVKTRRGTQHGTPIEAVDARKQARLSTVAQTYLGQRDMGGEEPDCRFDVVEVLFGPDGLARVSLRSGVFGTG